MYISLRKKTQVIKDSTYIYIQFPQIIKVVIFTQAEWIYRVID